MVEAAFKPRQAGFRGQALKNYVIFRADELTLSWGAGRSPNFSICQFLLCISIPIGAIFNLLMSQTCKNPKYFLIVSRYQLTLEHYWFGFYFLI